MKDKHPIVLFDGVCNFCNATVNFILKQDKEGKIRFAALQSEPGQKLLEKYNLDKNTFDSFILIDKGRAFKSSSAGLKLYNKLSWYWKWSQLFWIIPKIVRDAIYNFIARNRYKWFGRKEQCMIPGPEIRNRFLT